MAAKGSRSKRIELDLEKCRNEENWTKALDLAKQLLEIPNKASDFEAYSNFAFAEAKLELFLEEFPLDEKNTSKARQQLSEPEAYLAGISQTDTRVKFEAELLSAKIHYAKGQYQMCINTYDSANLDHVTLSVSSCRALCIIAEAFAIKGFSLDRLPAGATSKFKAAEREEKVIQCLEKAGDITLLFLQEKDKLPEVSTTNGKPSNILSLAIQRSPMLYIKQGRLDKGVGRFRQLLSKVESRCSQNLRQILSRQLAEVLLRGFSHNSYVPLNNVERTSSSSTGTPHKVFVPKNVNEEILLLLLISESIATRETVLDMSSELSAARRHAFNAVVSVYDLLTLCLVKRAQFTTLADFFERAMRYSFDEFHVWYQFALSLIAVDKFSRAVVIFHECLRLQPDNPVVALQAAKVCYENLYDVTQGLDFSKRAVAMTEGHDMASRAHTALGIGYALRAQEHLLHGDNKTLHYEALSCFKKAYNLDPNDYLAAYHMALQLAILRKIPESLKCVHEALSLNCKHSHSLHLLILLLTAQKQYEESLLLINSVLVEYPHNLGLLLTKMKLVEVVQGPEQALSICQQLLELWKGLHDITDEDSISQKKAGLIDRVNFDRRSVAQLQISEHNDRDSASLRAESVAASKVEKTLSDVASSFTTSMQPRSGPEQTWMLQAQIWLNLVELYISQDRLDEGEYCLNETFNICPHSHQVAFMKGRLHEHRKKFLDAKICYENALSINCCHIKSLQHLGYTLHCLHNDKMAEKYLREAANIEPSNPHTWYLLSEILTSMGQHKAACDCQLTATQLEATNPIVPFTIIPRLMT